MYLGRIDWQIRFPVVGYQVVSLMSRDSVSENDNKNNKINKVHRNKFNVSL